MITGMLRERIVSAVNEGWEMLVEKYSRPSVKSSKGSVSKFTRMKGGAGSKVRKGAGAYYAQMHGPFDSRGPGPIVNLILKSKGRGKKGKAKARGRSK